MLTRPDYPPVPERRAEALHYSASDMALEVNTGRKHEGSRHELSALRALRALAPPPQFRKCHPPFYHPSPLLKRDVFTQFGQEACRLAAPVRLTGAQPDQSGRLETAAGNAACTRRPQPALNAFLGVCVGWRRVSSRQGRSVFIRLQRQQETWKWLENVGVCSFGGPCRLKLKTVLSFAFSRLFIW